MPLQPWRAKQSTTTTGTGTLTLLSAATNARNFQAAFGASSRKVRYVLSGASYYEIGLGTYDGGAPGTLTRDTVLASSASGSLVTLPAGTTDVFAWIDPGDRGMLASTSGSVTLTAADLGSALIWTGTSAGTVVLPAVSTLPPGSSYRVRNSSTGATQATLTLDANGSETISGATTFDLYPGESAEVVTDGAAWHAFGVPTAPRLIRRLAVSSVATLDLALPAAFTGYRVLFERLRSNTDGARLFAVTSVDGGGSYSTGSSDYTVSQFINNATGGTMTAFATGTVAGFPLTIAQDTTFAGAAAQGELWLSQPSGSLYLQMMARANNFADARNYETFIATGSRNSSTSATHVRLTQDSGTFSATVSLYGV